MWSEPNTVARMTNKVISAVVLTSLCGGLWARDTDAYPGKSSKDRVDVTGVDCGPSAVLSCSEGTEIVSVTNWCDGWYDCTDDSDESNCPVVDCPNLWAVPDWYCNGYVNCTEAVDETDCWSCADTGVKIPGNWRCDGDIDCADASDETGCAHPTTFGCTDSSLSIPLAKKCDGWRDCRDDSDEASCPVVECYDMQAVPAWKCDGVVSCVGGVDEVGCQWIPQLER